MNNLIIDATPQQKQEAAEWLRDDARYLMALAAVYRAKGDHWLAEIVEANAAHNERLADTYQVNASL